MKIDQILPSCGSRDAIGTEVQIIRSVIQEAGFESSIYAENSWGVENVLSIDDFHTQKNHSEILIQHFSTGSDISYHVARSPSYNICRFQNVTPPGFFPKSSMAYYACTLGYEQIPLVVHSSQEIWVPSQFNVSCFGSGPKPPVHSLSVLRDYKELANNNDDPALQQKLQGDWINFIVVGRVSRNKCLHDSVFLLKTLKEKNPDLKIRILVCGILETDYVQNVFKLIQDLELSHSRFDEGQALDVDIVFMGSISDQQLATCYRNSLALLCMSDHEGFCVPLVEAMHFGIPIVAHHSTAIPETCGNGAILIDKNQPHDVFGIMQKLIHSKQYRTEWSQKSLSRSKDYDFLSLKDQFAQRLKHSIEQFETRKNKTPYYQKTQQKQKPQQHQVT